MAMARSHVARGLMSAKMLWMQHATSWDSITAEEDRKLSLPEQIYLQARIAHHQERGYEPGADLR